MWNKTYCSIVVLLSPGRLNLNTVLDTDVSFVFKADILLSFIADPV